MINAMMDLHAHQQHDKQADFIMEATDNGIMITIKCSTCESSEDK